MRMDFVFRPGPVAVTDASARSIFAIALGLAGSWRALGQAEATARLRIRGNKCATATPRCEIDTAARSTRKRGRSYENSRQVRDQPPSKGSW